METKTGKNNKVILVVEDDDISFFLLQEILSSIEMKAVRAKSKDDVLKLVENEKDFDVIIMDLILNGSENGFNIAKELNILNINIPVMIVSAYANYYADADKRNLQNVREVMYKPFNIDNFKSLLLKTIQSSE